MVASMQLDDAMTAVLAGFVLAVIGQAAVLWRWSAVAKERFGNIDARLRHQDDCIDSLKDEVKNGHQRVWARVDQLTTEMAGLRGELVGVFREREMELRRRQSGVK